jgi:hypothetical protein
MVRTTAGLHRRDRSFMILKGWRFDEGRKRGGASFDLKKFLVKVYDGKTITEYQKDQVVFTQGDAADAVFYFQKGRVKITVVSRPPSELSRRAIFLVRDVSMAIRCALRQRRPSLNA